MSLLADITAPYSSLEAWFYDAFIAPAVDSASAEMEADLRAAVAGARRVLDVGCGGGQLLRRLTAPRRSPQAVGVDLSLDQCRRAAARVAGGAGRAGIVCGSALDLPFRDECFDAVISVASIKHWPDPRRGVREILRVLRPGGRFVVVEADRGCRDGDIAAFVARMRLPAVLRPLARAAFRLGVAGRSLDLEDARALARGLPCSGVRAHRVPGMPALRIEGRKRNAPARGVRRSRQARSGE